MRKYIQILSALLVLAAVSCEKGTDGPGGSGTGNQEIRFPSGNSYHTGEDVIIICSGISSRASFWLVSADGTQTPLEDVTVTDSGIFFTPETAGEFTVVAEQDGERIELGRITVEWENSDIIITSVPEYCQPGESFTVTGTGFSDMIALYIEQDGIRTALDTDISGNNTVTAAVPENSPRGKFSLIISRGSDETLISENFFITTIRKLIGIKYDIATDMSFLAHSYELNASRSEDGTITAFKEYLFSTETGNDGNGEYCTYLFEPVSEDFGYSDFNLNVRNSQVLSSTFETTQGGIEGYYTFDWSYDDEGYITYAESNGSMGSIPFGLSDGNITLEDFGVILSYDDNTLVNNPFAADFTISVIATENEILRVAQIMGLTGNVSANLPTGIDGNTVTYEYDEEGYVVKASYIEPVNGFSSEIEYIYE